MKDNKTDERNQEQTGSTSNQPTAQDGNNKETYTNKPVEQKDEKNHPSVVVEDEDDTITNGTNKITDVPNKDQNNSKEVVNDDVQEEKITNTPSADDTGTNKRQEGVNL